MGNNTSSTINDFNGEAFAQCAGNQNISVNDITMVFHDGVKFRESIGSNSNLSDTNLNTREKYCCKNQYDDIRIDSNYQLKWEDVQYLIHCCYSGIIPDLEDRIDSLLFIIENIKREDIKTIVYETLKKNFIPRNIIKIYNSARYHGCEIIIQSSTMFILENFEKVFEEELFVKIEYNFLVELLSSDDLKASSEEIVLLALIKWIKSDEDVRKRYFCCLLKYIRIGRLENMFYLNTILEMCQPCHLCYGIFKDFITLKMIPERIPKISQKIYSPRACNTTLFRISSDVINNNYKKIEIYHANDKTWLTIYNIELDLKHFSITSFADRIIFLGGKNNYDFTNQVWCWSIKKNKNLKMAQMLVKRFHFGCATLNNQIIVCGGQNQTSKSLRLTEKWDPTDGRWKYIKCLKKGRSLHEAVTCKNQIYAIGGFSDEFGKCTNSVEKYDLISDYWEIVQPMKYARQDHAVAVLNDNIYVIGGYSDFLMSSCEKYDANAGCWSEIINLPSPQYGNAVSFSNNLIFFGNSDALMYNLEKGSWEIFSSSSSSSVYTGLVLNYKIPDNILASLN